MTFTAYNKLECARREVGMRRRVYPAWVENGRMSKEKAEEEIALMEAIESDYRALAMKERLL